MKVAFVCLLFIIGNVSAGEDCTKDKDLTTEAKLRKKIFCNYNKNVRPVKRFDNTTEVEFQLYLKKIFLDNHRHRFDVSGDILYAWVDEFLQWDPREYEGIDYVRVRSSNIWLPDVSSMFTKDYSFSSLTDGSDCQLAYTGYIHCFFQTTIVSHCAPDVTLYPYDSVSCTVTFSSRRLDGKYINLTIYDAQDPIDMSFYKPNKDWELKRAVTERKVTYFTKDGKNNFNAFIQCTFTLRRHSAGRFTMTILPAAVLAGLTLLVFWLDSMYLMRVGLAGFVIISDVLYLIYLGNNLPPNGDKAPVLVTFLRDSFTIASISVIVTTTGRSIRMKTGQPSSILTYVIAKMKSIFIIKFLFFKQSSVESEDTEEFIENAKNSPSAWDQLATVIDRSSFIICCFTYIILLIFYLP